MEILSCTHRSVKHSTLREQIGACNSKIIYILNVHCFMFNLKHVKNLSLNKCMLCSCHQYVANKISLGAFTLDGNWIPGIFLFTLVRHHAGDKVHDLLRCLSCMLMGRSRWLYQDLLDETVAEALAHQETWSTIDTQLCTHYPPPLSEIDSH